MQLSDKSELVGGRVELIASLDAVVKSTLGEVLLKSVTGTATLKGAMKAALEALPGGTVSAGNGAVELLAILDAVLTALQAETHGTGIGPSTPPINTADYAAHQAQLALIKS